MLPSGYIRLSLLTLLLLLIQAAIVTPGALRVRVVLRQEWLQQQVSALQALVELELDFQTGQEPVSRERAELALSRSLERAAHLEGLVGIKVWSADEELLIALPARISTSFPKDDLSRLLQERQAVAHYYPEAPLDRFFLAQKEAADGADLVEVLLPLQPAGAPRPYVAQFIMDGRSASAAFAEIDRQILLLAGLTILIGGALMTVLIVSYNRSLQRTNQKLREQAEALANAHRSLMMKSKVSALGALSGHLVHELKNHIMILGHFTRRCLAGVYSGENQEAAASKAEARMAHAALQRMHHLVVEVGDMLRQENREAPGSLSWRDLSEILLERVQETADRHDVEVTASPAPSGGIPILEANRILVVLQNLVRNAIEVSPTGSTVAVDFSHEKGSTTIRVTDSGPGLPKDRKVNPFAAGSSGKTDGWGIGLSLCAELARQGGDELKLEESASSGCCFSLTHFSPSTSSPHNV